MRLLILFAFVLGILGVHAQSPAILPPQNASDKVKEPSAAPEAGVDHIGGSVKPPSIRKRSSATYSQEARDKKISGSVIVGLIVDQNGMPQDIQVTRSLGYGVDEQALKAVQGYRFKPAMRDGQPVKVRIHLEIKFQIY